MCLYIWLIIIRKQKHDRVVIVFPELGCICIKVLLFIRYTVLRNYIYIYMTTWELIIILSRTRTPFSFNEDDEDDGDLHIYRVRSIPTQPHTKRIYSNNKWIELFWLLLHETKLSSSSRLLYVPYYTSLHYFIPFTILLLDQVIC